MTTTTTMTMTPMTTAPAPAAAGDEELLFSVSCVGTHLHWATHYGRSQDYNPAVFWRTPRLDAAEVKGRGAGAAIRILSRGLPDEPHDYIFGRCGDATPEDALAQAQRREALYVRVYVVGGDPEQEELLEQIWRAVPTKLTILTGEHFFGTGAGRSCEVVVGTSGRAALRGAAHLHGHPALVFDGGRYAATDGNGQLMGGGMGPGIQSRFYAVDAPIGTAADAAAAVLARVEEAREQGRPLPTFAKSSHEAMMADAFQDFALKGRHVVERWLAQTSAEDPAKANVGRRVVCTGGDGDLLMQLLQPGCNGLIEYVEKATSKKGALGLRYAVEANKHLVHYGIASAIVAMEEEEAAEPVKEPTEEKKEKRTGTKALSRKEETPKRKETETKGEEKREKRGARKQLILPERTGNSQAVGTRVAKIFEVADADGDNIFRGQVVKCVGDGFHIKYDDGDSEDVSMDELMEMTRLYAIHNKKGERKPRKAEKERTETRREIKAGKKEETPKKKEEKAAEKRLSVGSRVAKHFEVDGENGDNVFRGTVIKCVDDGFCIQYDDGDGEEVSRDELMEMLALYDIHGEKGERKPSKVAAARKAKNASKQAKPPDNEKAVATPSEKPSKRTTKEGAVYCIAPASRTRIEQKKKDDTIKYTPRDEEKKGKAQKTKQVETLAAESMAKSPKRRMWAPPLERKPVTKKPKAVESAMVSEPRCFVGKRIAKDFGGDVYFGTIAKFDDDDVPVSWHVEYDDGDEEDYYKKDLIKAVKYYETMETRREREAKMKEETPKKKEKGAAKRLTVGSRVAKRFEVDVGNGDNVFRGTVMKCIEDVFCIKYDDGDGEDVSREELMDMLALYDIHGEKEERKPSKVAAACKAKNASKQAKPSDNEKAVATPSALAKSSKRTTKEGAVHCFDPASRTRTEQKKKDDKIKYTPRDEEKKGKAQKTKQVDTLAAESVAKSPKRREWAPPLEKKPVTKKPKAVESAMVSEPRCFVGKRIAKDFGGDVYFGTVTKFDDDDVPVSWHVEYDDGDEEDYYKKDLIKAVKYYETMETRRERETKMKEETPKTKEKGAAKRLTVGSRVAKRFEVDIGNGDNVFRGTVMKCIKDGFYIKYDDSNGEDVSREELMDMLALYDIHGEKVERKPSKAAASCKAKNAPKQAKPSDNRARALAKSSKKGIIPEPVLSIARTSHKKIDQKKKDAKVKKAPCEEEKKKETQKIKQVETLAAESVITSPKKKMLAPPLEKKPVTKKRKTAESAMVSEPRCFVGKRIAKNFGGEVYFGTVTMFDDANAPVFWHVEYDDGDEEDYYTKDMIKAIKYYEAKGKLDLEK